MRMRTQNVTRNPLCIKNSNKGNLNLFLINFRHLSINGVQVFIAETSQNVSG